MTVWTKAKVDDYISRLANLRSELILHVVITSKDKLDAMDDCYRTAFQQILDRRTEMNEPALKLLHQLSDTQSSVSDCLIDIQQHLRTSEQDAVRRQIETLAALRSAQIASSSGTASHWQNSEGLGFGVDMRKAILRSLAFFTMDSREHAISQAYKKTFEWIFHDSRDGRCDMDNFSGWLHQGSGLYWVSGKAASGKSTLMKFLHQDPRTRQALKDWAGPNKLQFASFYFWNNGTNLQKSIEGLLRAILREVLEGNPELFPVLITDNWRELIVGNPGTSLPSPTIDHLRKAFQSLATQEKVPLKLCLLVDGLDEYDCSEVAYPDLAELFKSFTASKDIKAIVSSRPLLAFEEAFSTLPNLRLQDLTANDISVYFDGRISTHRRWDLLAQKDRDGALRLKTEIVSKASGVFLWVRLVMDLVLDDLTNGDDLSAIQHRLDELPEGLEGLFKHMLRNIRPDYRRQAYRLLQIVLQSQMLGVKRWTAARYQKILTLLALTYAYDEDRKPFLTQGSTSAFFDEAPEKCKAMESRVKNTCCGLIEVQGCSDSNELHALDGPLVSIASKELLNSEVRFLHKTVAEFLKKPGSLEAFPGSETSFDPSLALMRSYSIQLKHVDFSDVELPSNQKELLQTFRVMPWGRAITNAWAFTTTVLLCARWSQKRPMQIEILDDVDRTMSSYWADSRAIGDVQWCESVVWMEQRTRPVPWHDNFLALCVRHGLDHYLSERIRARGASCLRKPGQPMLRYALTPDGEWSDTINPLVVQTLLENGANPNELCLSEGRQGGLKPLTQWSKTLEHLYIHSFRYDNIYIWAKVFELLVLHGADPTATIGYGRRSLSAARLSRKLFLSTESDDYFQRDANTQDRLPADWTSIGTELIILLEERGGKEYEFHGGKQVYPVEQSKDDTPQTGSEKVHASEATPLTITSNSGQRVKDPGQSAAAIVVPIRREKTFMRRFWGRTRSRLGRSP